MDREAAAALASPDHRFRHRMSYEFVRLGPGDEHAYPPLNRALKPLGVSAPGCVRFGDHRARAVVFRLDPRTFEGVWFKPAGAAPGLPRRRLLLYDDTPESRMDYFARFERLMARASRLDGASGPWESRNGFDGWSSPALRGTAFRRVPGEASVRV
jgi:hypothetical protein